MRSHRKTRLRASLAAVAAAAGLWLAGGGLAADAPPAVLDALFPSGLETVPLASLPERVKLAPGENFKVVELARDAGTSQHVVAIRGAETPHRHDRHDLLVVILRGYGHMRIGAEERPVGEGSILYVPRGTVHAFRNQSPEPAVSYAVYVPPFDGKDRIEER
jgi:mannose-6-phosphate isomerase-like protein (cupin superfamily)